MLNPTVHLKQEDNQVLKLTTHELYQRIEQHTQMPKQKLSPNKFEQQLILKNPTSETLCAEYIIENLEVVELNPLLGNPSYIIEFDINIRALEESFGLDKAEVIMEYSTDLLGTSVALNDNIQVELTSEVVSNSYQLVAFDAAPNKVGVTLQRTSGSIPLIISNNTTEIYHAAIQVQNYSPNEILQLTVDENFDVSTCQISDGVISNLLCNIYSEDVTGVISDFFMPVITGISPTSTTAGTRSLLTITGNNFGSTRGNSELQFTVLDDNTQSGNLWSVPLTGDYDFWSDQEIRVFVPSYSKIPGTLDSDVDGTTLQRPGTGSVRVNKEIIGGVTQTSNNSDILTITYSVGNDKRFVNSPGIYEGQPQALTRQRDDGGYTVRFSFDFTFDTSGNERKVQEGDTYVQLAKDAIEEWRCITGLNYTIDESTYFSSSFGCEGSTTADPEDKNIIGLHFKDTPDDPFSAAAMNGLPVPYDNIDCDDIEVGLQPDVDLLKCAEINVFGTQFSGSGNTRLRFYNAILHELGHTHFVNHVSSTDELMHPSQVLIVLASAGEMATITENAVAASRYIQEYSLNHNCQNGPYISDPCYDSVETVSQTPSDFFNIYTNSENIIVRNQRLKFVNDVRIFDTAGRLLTQHSVNHSNDFILLPRVEGNGIFIATIVDDENILYTFKISQL